MLMIIGIDDTDNHDSEKGTGRLVTQLASQIEHKEWGVGYGVVRHQLFVHHQIPYTSHNSSMSLLLDFKEQFVQPLILLVNDFLIDRSAPGSDPGFCLLLVDQVEDKEALIEYGYKAKTEVLTKDSAYQLADKLNLHLSEHGGSGDGVIGALAAVGLRLSGNDGRFRGKHFTELTEQVITVEEILTDSDVVRVLSTDGALLSAKEKISLGEKVKSVLIDNERVLLVVPTSDSESEVRWQSCPMEHLRKHY